MYGSPTDRVAAENNNTKAPEWLPSENTLSALIIFGFALVFCFYADRTQVFNKFHKSYTNSSFLSLIFATIAVGLLTLKKSSETATDQPFLFRDQTDEWKGWMQFAILVYHYTGGSKVAWIYGFIRVTVASYLFMTGYGHTFYFYKKGDYSFKRVAGVMLRLNLLSCALPYIMKTDYLFYYFAPLVTWWYFIVYFTMRIGKKYNVNTRFLVGKILFSALFTTAITKIPGILEAVFGVINFVCRTNWNVQEWRFRVALDMWIVYVGMLVAIAYIKLSDTSNPYHRLVADYRSKVIPASAVSVVLFLMFQTTRETKFVYNAYHPYISWIPILGFIILRNATPNLRNTYSGAFAWIGKCSLETFTLQFHIWLAADTRGILDFGIFGPYAWWSNLAISSFVFLYTCDNVSAATGGLTAWIMGAPPRRPPVPRQPQQEQGEQLSVLPTTNPAATSSAEAAQPVEPKPAPSSRTQQQDAAPEKWWSGLKARCAGILLALWVLNIVSSPNDFSTFNLLWRGMGG